MEHCKVKLVDIPGAFMQSGMEGQTVHMKFEGKMEELMTKLDAKLYQKYVTNKKGRTFLYMELKIPILHAPGSTPVLEKCSRQAYRNGG